MACARESALRCWRRGWAIITGPGGAMRLARATKPPASLRRRFVTPEGVDLQLELGGAGTRAAAFLIDVLLMVILLIVASIALFAFGAATRADLAKILWLIGAFC